MLKQFSWLARLGSTVAVKDIWTGKGLSLLCGWKASFVELGKPPSLVIGPQNWEGKYRYILMSRSSSYRWGRGPLEPGQAGQCPMETCNSQHKLKQATQTSPVRPVPVLTRMESHQRESLLENSNKEKPLPKITSALGWNTFFCLVLMNRQCLIQKNENANDSSISYQSSPL